MITVRPDTLEEVMQEVAAATDSKGRRIKLYTGPVTARDLRVATMYFMENFGAGNVWLEDIEDKTLESRERAEAKGYENLALLARATAAAIREGK